MEEIEDVEPRLPAPTDRRPPESHPPAESAVPGEPEAVEAPSSAVWRLAGVFLHPRRTFESMRPRPHFLLALAVVLVIQTILAFVMYRSGVIAEQTVAKMEAQGRDQRQIEAVESFFEGPAGFLTSVVTAPFASAVGLLFGAGLLYFMANLMMGAKLRFAHYLSAMAFAGVVQILDQIVRVGLIVANRTFDVRLGLGALFPDTTGVGIRMLDTLTDPLFLWGSAVCAIGVSAYAQRKLRFGVLAVLPGLLLAVFLAANR